MTETALPVLQTWLVALTCGAGVVAVLQIGLALWICRRIDAIGAQHERLSRLADGLALLTDTTDTGLGAILAQLQDITRRQAGSGRPAGRAAVQKRVVAAARKGRTVERIAEAESLSESEVRLHLALAGVEPGGRAAAAATAAQIG